MVRIRTMGATGYTLFPTPIGHCAIAWTPHGIAGVWLPEANDLELQARLNRRFARNPESPPSEVRAAIEAIVALLCGAPADLTPIALDLNGVPAFHRRVYALTRAIAPGRTRTYGEIAAELGEPGSARAVGQALGRNPFPIVVPCHRVLGAGGRAGGFSAPGGTATKLRLLEIEGALDLPLLGGH
jgi:methylated-DNA-[protein]-cysteine S-methyltransferase